MKSKYYLSIFFKSALAAVVLSSAMFVSCVQSSNNDSGKSDSTLAQEIKDAGESVAVKKEDSKKEWKIFIDSILAAKSNKSYHSGDVSYSGLTFKITKRFNFDRYDDTYHYLDAERGEKIIWSDLTIKSKDKNPTLHGFGVYYLDADSSFVLIDVLNYRFYRWEDYGTYLGNYHDNTNDFAYKESIRFSLYGKISDDLLNKKIFVVTKKSPMFNRTEDRFGNPPVSYSSANGMLNKISAGFEWKENGYKFVARIN